MLTGLTAGLDDRPSLDSDLEHQPQHSYDHRHKSQLECYSNVYTTNRGVQKPLKISVCGFLKTEPTLNFENRTPLTTNGNLGNLPEF